MFTQNWSGILDALSVVKVDYIDKEQIKTLLNMKWSYNAEVLDSLYLCGILTEEEYAHYMDVHISCLKDQLKFAEECRDEAIKKKEDFNPMLHYGLARKLHGSVIEAALHSES